MDWGLGALAFAAITGGIMWVMFFGYTLYTMEPPMSTMDPSLHTQSTPTTHPTHGHKQVA